MAKIRIWTQHIDSLSFTGSRSIVAADLQQRMAAGDIPYVSRIVLSTVAGRVTVPLDSRTEILQPVSKNAKWIGLAVGGAIDIGVIVLLKHSPPRLFDFGRPGHDW